MSTLEERIRQLEAQMSMLLGDYRIGQVPLGPLPVDDSYLGIRRRGNVYYTAGTHGSYTPSTKTIVVTANRLYAAPLYVGEPFAYDRLAILVSSAVAGNARLGVYDTAKGDDLFPGSLLLDAGTVTTGTVGPRYLDISGDTPSLGRGLKWLAIVFDAAPTMLGIQDEAAWGILGKATVGASFNVGWWSAFTYGALPFTFPTSAP